MNVASAATTFPLGLLAQRPELRLGRMEPLGFPQGLNRLAVASEPQQGDAPQPEQDFALGVGRGKAARRGRERVLRAQGLRATPSSERPTGGPVSASSSRANGTTASRAR